MISLNVEPYCQLNLLVFKKGHTANTILNILCPYGERLILIHKTLSLYFSCRGFSFDMNSQTHYLNVAVRLPFLILIFGGLYLYGPGSHARCLALLELEQ